MEKLSSLIILSILLLKKVGFHLKRTVARRIYFATNEEWR